MTAQGGGGGTLSGDTDVAITSPLLGHALLYNGAAWGNKYPWKLQLNYVAAVDLATSLAVLATTWTTIGSAQSFTVDDATSSVEASISGVILNGPNTIGGLGLLIDGTTRYVIGGWENDTSGGFVNALAGSGGPVSLAGLVAGSHTIAVQIWTTLASTAFCRPSTKPNQEALRILVMERK